MQQRKRPFIVQRADIMCNILICNHVRHSETERINCYYAQLKPRFTANEVSFVVSLNYRDGIEGLRSCTELI